MAEFVDGIESLTDVGKAVSIFGSARVKPDDPYYKKTQYLARRLAEKRPDLLLIDYLDYQKAAGDKAARDFFNV